MSQRKLQQKPFSSGLRSKKGNTHREHGNSFYFSLFFFHSIRLIPQLIPLWWWQWLVKGPCRRLISEEQDPSSPIRVEIPRMWGQPVTCFLSLPFSCLDTEVSPNAKVFCKVRQQKPQDFGQNSEKGRFRKLKNTKEMAERKGFRNQSHKVVYELQGSSQSLTYKDLILISISKNLWADLSVNYHPGH